MSARLKPCPFCGEDVAERRTWDDRRVGRFIRHSIDCPEGVGGCGASTKWFETAGEAVAVWNHRTADRTFWAVGSWGALQEDLRALLRLLKLGDHARTYSPHEVMQTEVIPAVEKLVRGCAICGTYHPATKINAPGTNETHTYRPPEKLG